VKLHVFKYWHRVRSSFWFVPATMAAAAVALAFGSVSVDAAASQWLAEHLGWKFTGGAEGASAVLGIIAGSMITIAGTVFSMTLVALSLASSQLGPRLLRTFMRDTSTQVVLGTFIAAFVYCVLVLRTIRRAEEILFVPHMSVSLGVVLAVVSVGVLIYFIHHVSVSIQANEVAARITKELIGKVTRLFPERAGLAGLPAAGTPDADTLAAIDADATPIPALTDGYLQFIDRDALLTLATETDVVIRLERKTGNFVVAGQPLLKVGPAAHVSEQLRTRAQGLFVMGTQRTSDQDIEFGVNQLVEMAVRALSPGINDPFTAMACVDHLGSVLCRIAARDMPSAYHYDDQKRLRLIGDVDTFPQVMDAAFNQIRQYARSSAAVTIRLLEAIAVISGAVHRPEDRAALLRHADMIARGAREGLPEEEDRRVVNERWQVVRLQ